MGVIRSVLATLRCYRSAALRGLGVLGLLGLASGSAAQSPIDDPYYGSYGAWGQSYEDQWALQRVGFTRPGSGDSAWDVETGASHPVTVAVIDTGLDYLHPDLRRTNLWRNPRERLNGGDDDGNGYVDDVIGWNFVDGDNNPWDRAGHGTHVAGVIAAATANGEGIAGINRGVRIMPLKVLNLVGHGHSSSIAAAILYAVQSGARVINLSLGGPHVSWVERDAIEHAGQQGVVVVVAAGNMRTDVEDSGLAGLPNVIAVAATDMRDARAAFSSWGEHVEVAAPGTEILSLRARWTDLLLFSGAEHDVADAAVIGADARYYRASGTSFAAAFVSGIASLLFAKSPELTGEQVTRMILHSARDLDPPGVDQLTGYGLVDARAALLADPEFFIEATISAVELVRGEGDPLVAVRGSADASEFVVARLERGAGPAPESFEPIVVLEAPVARGLLARFPVGELAGASEWMLRLVTEHRNGRTRETRYRLRLGS